MCIHYYHYHYLVKVYYSETFPLTWLCPHMYVLCIYKFLCPHMYLQVPFVLYLSVLIFPCYISAALLVSSQLGSIRAIIKELSYPTVRNIIIYNYYTRDHGQSTNHLHLYGAPNATKLSAKMFCPKSMSNFR